MVEIWKDIKGYEGLYQVSNLGRVKSLERYRKNHNKLQKVEEKIKNMRQDKQGYLLIDLYKGNKAKTIRVHRLVAETFLKNADNKETVNHIDGNKLNNRIDNLEWSTFKEQNEHFYLNNLKSKENIDKAIKAMNKANSKKVKCLNTGEIYASASEAGRMKNIHGSSIMACCRGARKSAGKDKDNKPLYWIYI
ncbi:NUMOD4 motif-containing HNH endonuclease [Clostridium sp.]|uniref:NUMOD4 motif-containing HNH endonuclease n=1 Tax=Clostridium sp. TaxID=1506 RepID=UPI0032165D21